MADSHWPEISGHSRLGNAHREGDLSPSRDGHRALSAHRVFVSHEVLLDVSFPAAQASLARLIRGSLLGSASAQAYSDGITGLARFGPPGSAPGLPRLVQVYVRIPSDSVHRFRSIPYTGSGVFVQVAGRL